MAIDVTCGNCGRTYRVPNDKAGHKFRCRQCDGAVLVPSAGHELIDSAVSDEFGDPVPPRQVRPSSTASRPRKTGKAGTSGGAAGRSPKAAKEQGRRKFAGIPLWGWIVGLCSLGLMSVALCLGVIVWLGWEEPPVLDDKAVRPLVEQAMAELQAKQTALFAIIHEDSSWLLDQDAGTITFDMKSGMRAVSPVQIIGSYDTADGTWLWAWDNPSVVKQLAGDSVVVREYGRKHGIAPLTTRKLKCDEPDCWEFTALACKLCGAQGAYRGPSGTTRVFMTFGKLRISKKPVK